MNLTAIGIKFNGLNYDEWIEYIKYHAGITCIDTALVMENKPAEPTDSSTEAEKDLWETWERSNRLLLSFLKLSIADNVKPSMPRSTNVREFLAEIKNFTNTDVIDKSVVATLMTDLSTKKYDISQSMHDHLTHMVNVANKLKAMNMELNETFLVQFILQSLQGDEFERFRQGYNTLKEKWNLQETKAMLLQEEARQRAALKLNPAQAHLTVHSNANVASSSKTPSNKEKKKGKQPMKVKGDAQKVKKCHFCGKVGHFKNECLKRMAWFEKKGIHYVFVCFESNLIEVPSNTWWLDTGATTHVSHISQGFLTIQPIKESEKFLFMGNRMKAQVEGIGTYRLILDTGYRLDLEKCLYVPECARNLISVSRLDILGFDFRIGNKCFSLYRRKCLLGTGTLLDALYCFNLNSEFAYSLFNVECDVGVKRSALDESSAYLWHKRLGYISKERIMRLVNSEILSHLDFTDWNDICVDCIKGKQTKHISKKSATRSIGLIDLIHTDICGHFDVPSWGEEKYFITFIDDHSRYCYLYLLHEKPQTVDVLQTFITEVERQLNRKVKVIRSDRGGEYYGKTTEVGQVPGPFAKFLESKGICAQYTMPGTPQQNGVAERRDRTLMDMVRSMMNNSSVPVSLWMYALRTAAYLLNRIPSKAVPKTPYELWTGRKPSLRHLHVWGCQTEVRIYNPHERKLDPRTISGFFIGYLEKSKGYRFYCPNHSMRILESGNARFIENGNIGGSSESRNIEIKETLVETSTSNVPSQVIVLVTVAQTHGNYGEQQHTEVHTPHHDVVVNEEEDDNVQVDEQVQPQ